MSKKKQPGIIILGGHVQGLGILRILGEKGIPGILIDNTRINIARHSKYCRTFYSVKDNNLLTFLSFLGRTKKYLGWLIFPTNDFQVELLSQNKTKLEQYFKVSTPAWEIVEPCYNKRLTYKLAQKLSVPIPKTWMPDSLADIKYYEIEYPCIVKPAVMFKFYKKSGRKVFMCKNQEELIQNYNKACKIISPKEIIIQEVIPGDSSKQYSACFLFHNQKSLLTLTVRRARQHPIDFGNATTYAETINLPELVRFGEILLEKINYEGLCEVEFKYDNRDKKYKFLEINPRTWKWHVIAKKANIPFLEGWYKINNGLNFLIEPKFKHTSFQHATTDFPVLFNLLLHGRYNKTSKQNLQKAVWDNKDILPAFFEILYLPYFILNR